MSTVENAGIVVPVALLTAVAALGMDAPIALPSWPLL